MKHSYSPYTGDDCSPCVEKEREPEYPTVHLDVGPSQLKGLEVGEDVEIVIRGKVKSLRYDTSDTWGTGASVCISLRSSEIGSTEAETVIDELLEGE